MRSQVYLLAALPALLLAAGAPAQESATAAEAADRVRTKVIILKTSPSGSRGAANGYLVRPGLLLTAAHAVAQAGGITAWVNGVAYPARFVAAHPDYDLAVLEFEPGRLLLKPVDLARTSEHLAADEPLVILTGPAQPAQARGDPADRVALPAAYHQRVLLRDASGHFGPMLKLTATVRKGDSGSPVVRVRDGTIVGTLCSRQAPDASGVSRYAFAAPIEAVHAWLESVAPKRPEVPEAAEFYLLRIGR